MGTGKIMDASDSGKISRGVRGGNCQILVTPNLEGRSLSLYNETSFLLFRNLLLNGREAAV
jgi:hypothetical protein